MVDALETIKSLPDISFIDDITLQDMQGLLITAFQEKYEELTGEQIRLRKADPNRIILLAVAQYLYQGLQQIEKAGRMNYLKYSYGPYLRQLAAFKGVTPIEAKKAEVTVRWSLAEARSAVTPIPAGTRVTPDGETYFETTEYAEIPIGDTELDLVMACTEAGTSGNGFLPGEIAIVADPVAFIDTAVNITESAGGADEETDESLIERIFLAPGGYSTAGPEDAYIYHAKTFDSNIGDVVATSPSPGVVDIRFIMSDGSLPDTDEIAGLLAYLEAADRKPLTDSLQVDAPTAVSYTVTATYYINRSDKNSAGIIQEAAEQALEDYKAWQCARIGRDINPDELISRLKAAGVKRIVITAPELTSLTLGQVASCTSATLTYGGLEDD